MVEGGSAVITSFLQARLVNRIAITIAPRLMGGLRAVGAVGDIPLHHVHYHILGQDVMVEGEIQ
jgi:riboflavin biosynthesis pyrimidine reductase